MIFLPAYILVSHENDFTLLMLRYKKEPRLGMGLPGGLGPPTEYAEKFSLLQLGRQSCTCDVA